MVFDLRKGYGIVINDIHVAILTAIPELIYAYMSGLPNMILYFLSLSLIKIEEKFEILLLDKFIYL